MKYHTTIEYNPLQRETAKYVDEDCNLVVMAPTSSGKTIVAEQFIYPALIADKKAVYLSPLKALTSEKLRDWDSIPVTKVAITGDHSSKGQSVTEKLVLMTTESLDSKTRGGHAWLYKVGVLVSDESHMLAMDRRGDAFEVGLTRFASINPDARIIFLSATIPNAKELGTWLTKLNGKPTHVVETDWRPVTQEHILVKAREEPWNFLDDVVKQVESARELRPDSQMLVFVHSVATGNSLAKRLHCPFHYSKVSKPDRDKLEAGFREKKIMTMISTSTLAYGVNLPADVGVIAGAHRGPMNVDPADIKQMAGRIGRYGLAKEGIVYYVFKRDHADEMWHLLQNIPEIKSVLPQRLYFHIVSFIARERKQRDEIEQFLSMTLAAQQTNVLSFVDEAISTLVQYKALTQGEDGTLAATPLGRAAALMYVDPIDLFHIKQNLEEKPVTPSAIARALVSIPSLEVPTHVPDLQEPMQFSYGQQTILGTCLREWLRGNQLDMIGAVVIPPFVKDAERWMAALAIAGVNKPYLKSLGIMVANGVQEYLIDLVELRGIGRKRALDLYHKGIKTKQDILDNHIAKNILGNKTYLNVINQINPDGKVYFTF